MIVDKIENIKSYKNLSQNINQALTFITNTDFTNTKDGKYNINNDMFYIVQRYETKPFAEGELEAHKEYIDIQYIVTGTEVCGHALLDDLKIEQPYNKEKDIAFYHQPQNINIINLTAAMFCIFFPHDAHMPCRYLDHALEVLKVVVKVRKPPRI